MDAIETRAPGLRELATYLAARVLPALASMGLTFLCIHSLSAADYGVYSLTMLPAGVVTGLIGGLSAQAMLRYAHELAPGELRRGLVVLPLAASLPACVLLLGYLAWTVGLYPGALVAVASVPLVTMMDTRRSLFVARARAGSVFALDALRAAIALALAWLLFRAWGDRPTVPLLAQAISVAACLWLVRAQPAVAQATQTRQVDPHYLRYGLWFAGWLAVVGALAVAERTVVEAVSGIAASGRYAAQADVVNAIFAATGGALASSMMPRYLAMSQAEHGPTYRHLLRIGLAGTALTAVLCLALGAGLYWQGRQGGQGAGQLAQALVGDPQTGVVLVLAGAVWTAAGFVQKPLEMRGQTRLTFASVLVALLLFFAIGPILGQHLGPLGVGLAKVAAGLVFVALVVIATRRRPTAQP
jgi:O-antigen/teichoic acid export membrane protein